MTGNRPARLGLIVLATLVLAGFVAGCDAPRLLAPPVPLRAASANDFGVDLEFAEPLDRASAEDLTHYTVRPAAAGSAPHTIFSAAIVDTFYGRVVQLLISDGPLADTSEYVVEALNVRTLAGGSTGSHTVTFRTGLSYRAALRELFDSRCSSCHGAAQAAGGYRTDSYAALFGNGTDTTPDVIAGNPACLLLRKCRPGRSMWDAGRLSYFDFEILLNWVVSYGARL